MPLRELLKALTAKPTDSLHERRLRAYFANMRRGLELGHIRIAACRARLLAPLAVLKPTGARKPSKVTWDEFYTLLMDAVDGAGERDHYDRPQPLDCETDLPAVTFQRGDFGAMIAWMGHKAAPLELIQAVRFKTTRVGATVGRANTPLWLTPCTPSIEALLIRGRKSPDPALASEVRSLMAGSHWRSGDDIFAFITEQPISDLRLTRLDAQGNKATHPPVGSTVIEARSHRHFRHWPRPGADHETYGRTYNLDGDARRSANPPGCHGVREAICTSLPMSDFIECVYIGRLDPDTVDAEPDDEFLGDVSAEPNVDELLRQLIESL